MSMLAHRNPTNHPTDWWDQVILAIPKGADLHSEQLAFLKGMDCEPIERILDIGSGEGTFTETALTLLFQAGRLAPSVHVDIVEQVDELWDVCERRLSSCAERLASQGIELSFCRVLSPRQIPQNQEELFSAFDLMYRECGVYPLIIASHVTYYFHDGGIDFAYALLTRMLAYGGYAWFVVRDRNCPFYRLRKKMLVEKGLPDINTHQFADSFLNSLKALFPGVSSNRRDFQLKLTEYNKKRCQRTIEYLTWLVGLEQSEINQFLMHENRDGNRFSPNLGFSEQHIWIRNSGSMSQSREKERLPATHAISRCLNSLWEIVPDLTPVSVSLAEIAPSSDLKEQGKPDNAGKYVQEDHARPMAFPGFHLVRFGFEDSAGNTSFNNLLDEYFQTHTSFLYYPRFYIDHTSLCPETRAEAYYHTVVRTGEYHSDIPDSYVCRSGDESEFPVSPSIISNSTFSKALEAWGKLTEDYYISEKKTAGLWSFAVGTHLLPGGAFRFEDDPHLNSRCAIFITAVTDSDFGRLSGYAVGHIKTILTQYLAQKVYKDVHDRLKEAEKAAQVMRLMQRPLEDLAAALDSMQRDTQELKSILYEPSEALFKGYSRISHLFEQGRKVAISNALQVTIQHSASGYREAAEARALLCQIICRCCGKDRDLETAETFVSYAQRAVSILTDMERQTAFSSIVRGIKFLCDIEEFSELMQIDLERLHSILDSFKYALFTPFKLDSRSFHGIALALLFEACPGATRGIRDARLTVQPEWVPLRYSSILSFLSKVHFEYLHRSKGNDCLESLRFLKHPEGGGIELLLRGRPMFEKNAAGPNLVRQRMSQLVFMPRDWRIDHANVGDFMASFVALASSLLGIGDAWTAEETADDDLLLLLSQDRKRYFRLSIQDDRKKCLARVTITWCPVGAIPQ